jgi:hypothetical protein
MAGLVPAISIGEAGRSIQLPVITGTMPAMTGNCRSRCMRSRDTTSHEFDTAAAILGASALLRMSAGTPDATTRPSATKAI